MTADAPNVPSVQGAREARYAEAIHKSAEALGIEDFEGSDARFIAQDVTALVDAEVAAAVSEAQAERDVEVQRRGDVVAEYLKAGRVWDAQRDRLNAALDRARMERAQAEDAETSAEAEVERLREGIRALADEWDSDRHRVLDDEQDPRRLGWRTAVVDHTERLRALLTPSPAATTGEAGECLSVRVLGQMSAMLCDDDGWVRSGMWHHGTDYKCTGSVHPPLDSPIWPGREIRCANPIHVVTLPLATPMGTVTISTTSDGA